MNLAACVTVYGVRLAPALAAAMLLILGAAPASATPAYLGEWGLNAASCRSGDAELGITHTHWSEVDSVCRIRSITGGNGVWQVNLYKCTGEGVKPTASVTIWASATRATTHYRASTFRNNFVRCH